MMARDRLKNLDRRLLTAMFTRHCEKGESWSVLSKEHEAVTGKYIAPFRLSVLARNAYLDAENVLVDEHPDAIFDKIEQAEAFSAEKTSKNAKNQKKCSKICNFVKKTAIFATFLHQMTFFGQRMVMKAIDGVAAWKNA